MKITKNKQGFVANPAVLLIAFIAFGFIAFIFYILFGMVGSLSVFEIESSSQSTAADIALLNYLRTPVNVEGDYIIVADLIVKSVNQEDYTLLKEKTQELLGRGNAFYSILIYDKEEYDSVEKGEKFYWTPGSLGLKLQMHSREDIAINEDSISEINIPNYNTLIPSVKIFLSYGEGRGLTEEETISQDLGASSGP
ncbi:MAG: hypothetical protein U9O94_03770 [Nanoarchaeota archaeon]|nr:hypothetical protein [Nanoarchaeota archaeon]